MPVEITVPQVGESITEVEIGGWLKNQGEVVRKDDPLVTLESEKATVELPAPESGTIIQILKQKGESAKVGEVIARLEKDGAQTGGEKSSAPPRPEAKREAKAETKPAEQRIMPAAQVALEAHGLQAGDVQGTGPGGRVL